MCFVLLDEHERDLHDHQDRDDCNCDCMYVYIIYELNFSSLSLIRNGSLSILSLRQFLTKYQNFLFTTFTVLHIYYIYIDYSCHKINTAI